MTVRKIQRGTWAVSALWSVAHKWGTVQCTVLSDADRWQMWLWQSGCLDLQLLDALLPHVPHESPNDVPPRYFPCHPCSAAYVDIQLLRFVSHFLLAEGPEAVRPTVCGPATLAGRLGVGCVRRRHTEGIYTWGNTQSRFPSLARPPIATVGGE